MCDAEFHRDHMFGRNRICVLGKYAGGIPNGRCCGQDSVPDMLMLWYLFEKYDLNHRRTVPEMPKCLWRRCKRIG